MIAAIRSEWGKTWSVRAPAVWLTIAAVAGMVTAFSLANDALLGITSGEPGAPAAIDPIDAITPGVQVAQIAVAAFAIHLVTPEWASESMRVTVAASPRRWRVLVAKAFVAVVTASVVGALVGAGMHVALRVLLDGHIGADSTPAATGLATASMAVVAASLGVALGFIGRSAVAALCIAAVLLVGSLTMPRSVGQFMPGPAGADVMEQMSAGTVPIAGLLALAAWSTVPLLAATEVLRRRDI
ncbi:MAG: hypothetical protein PGN29_19365 [Gordonia paraffinivorans]